MIIKDLTKNVEIVLKICQYSYLKWNNPRAPPGERDVHCFTRRIYLHIRHTDCSDGWTHTLMIYSPSTNSLSYLSWWTSFFSLSSTLYSRSSEQVISSSTVRLPSPWAVCLFEHTVHLTFSHCHDGTLLHIKLLYTHTRTHAHNSLALGSSSSSWVRDHIEGATVFTVKKKIKVLGSLFLSH